MLAENIVAPVNVPPFDNSAVDGYAVRGEDLDADGEKRLAIVDRVAAGHAARTRSRPARRSAFSPARRCRPAPIPFSCRRIAAIDGDGVIVPPGLKRGANRRLAGEDMRAGRSRLAGRPAARGAARRARRGAWAHRSSTCTGAFVSLCSRPATRSSSRDRSCRARRSTIPTVICSPACSRGSAPRSPISAFSATIRKHLARALARGRGRS